MSRRDMGRPSTPAPGEQGGEKGKAGSSLWMVLIGEFSFSKIFLYVDSNKILQDLFQIIEYQILISLCNFK